MELYEQYEQVELTHEIFEEVDSQDWDALAYKNSAFFGAKVASFYKDKELQAKDTTIKEQAERIEKLTGLLKEHVYNRAYDIHMANGSTTEYSWDMGRKAVADFCKQHGI